MVREPKSKFFEIIETYVDDSHLIRDLLKCRECGQLYFHEFYEQVISGPGGDSQYSTYIPVETPEEIELLRKASVIELSQFAPRLQKDFPTDAENPSVHWVKK